MSRLHRVFYSFALFAILALPALAQFNASLQGTVTDTSGGVIQGAHVKLVNAGTQATQDITANDQGFFRFNKLPAGTYTVTVDATGFQTATLDYFQVAADLPQTANATLQAGNVQSTTTVTASAVPTLQTADASVSGTITGEEIQKLPSSRPRSLFTDPNHAGYHRHRWP